MGSCSFKADPQHAGPIGRGRLLMVLRCGSAVQSAAAEGNVFRLNGQNRPPLKESAPSLLRRNSFSTFALSQALLHIYKDTRHFIGHDF